MNGSQYKTVCVCVLGGGCVIRQWLLLFEIGYKRGVSGLFLLVFEPEFKAKTYDIADAVGRSFCSVGLSLSVLESVSPFHQFMEPLQPATCYGP